MVELAMLGPLAVRRDGETVDPGGPRQRAVLARLALDVGRSVPVDVLIEDVWAGRPPSTAHKTLQKYVSALRKVLGADVIRTTAHGYVLDLPSESVDVRRFEALVAEGQVDAALELWRGDLAVDCGALASAVVPERTRLDELRVVALQGRLERAIEDGRLGLAIGELTDLVDRYPLHERFTALLALALYRAGRQVDALRACDRHRRRLAEEVGLEPADELQRLEQAILDQDRALDAPDSPVEPRSPVTVRRPRSRFVGREPERAHLRATVAAERFVTLVGPAGVGKTRLASEVAADLADAGTAIWWADLSGVANPDLVAQTVATALGVDGPPELDEAEQVVAALAPRGEAVLVLDDCEHLLDSVGRLVDDVLSRCAGCRVLTTSRTPLGLDGEFVISLAPLRPDEAAALFAERARGVGAEVAAGLDEETIALLCDRLDRLPLALELAASQLRTLTPADLVTRLDQRLSFRSRRRDAPPRHETLDQAIAWSHDRLDEASRRCFARLGVFRGTFDVAAVGVVCEVHDPLGLLTTLVDASMVTVDPARNATRFRLLETIRLFALDRLAEAGDESAARRTHARHYAAVANDAAREHFAADGSDGSDGSEGTAWIARLELEDPNLHSALAWAKQHDGDTAARLAVALWPYWLRRRRARHGLPYLELVLERFGDELTPELRAGVLTAMAELRGADCDAGLATASTGSPPQRNRKRAASSS